MSIGQFMPMGGDYTPFQVEYITGKSANWQSAAWDVGTLNVPTTGWVVIAAAVAGGFNNVLITAIEVDGVAASVLFTYTGTESTLTGAMICKVFLTAGNHTFMVRKNRTGNLAYPCTISLYSTNKEPSVTDSVQIGQAKRTSTVVSLTYSSNSYGIFTHGLGSSGTAGFSTAVPHDRQNHQTNTVVTALREQLIGGMFDETVTHGSSSVDTTAIGISIRG